MCTVDVAGAYHSQPNLMVIKVFRKTSESDHALMVIAPKPNRACWAGVERALLHMRAMKPIVIRRSVRIFCAQCDRLTLAHSTSFWRCASRRAAWRQLRRCQQP